MKNKVCFILIGFMILAMAMLSACGKSEFNIDAGNEKCITIDAKNAAVDEVVVTGSLAVTDCDQVLLTSNLEKGVIQVELYKTADEQSIDEVPDIPDEDPVMTFNANDTDSMSGTVEPGSYLVKAIVSEKATGTVKIEAILADCSNGGSK